MNVNEAHAYASCNSCAAVAFAYQVVFVVDTDETDDNVAAPQNLAGALNYDCVELPHVRPGTTAVHHAGAAADRRGHGRPRRGLGGDRGLETRINSGELTPEEIDAIDEQLEAYTSPKSKRSLRRRWRRRRRRPRHRRPASETAVPAASSTASPTAPPSPTAASTAAPTQSPAVRPQRHPLLHRARHPRPSRASRRG